MTDDNFIKKLNEQLAKGENPVIPEDLRVVTDMNIEFDYKVSENLPVPENYKVALETLDGILADSKLGIHIIEPMAKEVPIKHVVPRKPSKKIEKQGVLLSRDL